MMQNLYKNWLLVSKIKWGNWTTQASSWKSKKLKFDGLLFSKKHIPLAKTLCTEDFVNLALNYLFKIPVFIFETISRFSRHNPLYFLAQTLHTFDKSSQSKWKLWDFEILLALKSIKFLMSFFKQIFQSLDPSSVS